MNRNTMFQLVFNLVWALPLDTGQKLLVIFIKCKFIWKINAGESLYFGAYVV